MCRLCCVCWGCVVYPQESQAAAATAQALADRVAFSHPSLPAWLRSKQTAASILTEQHGFLQHLADAGAHPLLWQRGVLVGTDTGANLMHVAGHPDISHIYMQLLDNQWRP